MYHGWPAAGGRRRSRACFDGQGSRPPAWIRRKGLAVTLSSDRRPTRARARRKVPDAHGVEESSCRLRRRMDRVAVLSLGRVRRRVDDEVAARQGAGLLVDAHLVGAGERRDEQPREGADAPHRSTAGGGPTCCCLTRWVVPRRLAAAEAARAVDGRRRRRALFAAPRARPAALREASASAPSRLSHRTANLRADRPRAEPTT